MGYYLIEAPAPATSHRPTGRRVGGGVMAQREGHENASRAVSADAEIVKKPVRRFDYSVNQKRHHGIFPQRLIGEKGNGCQPK